METNTSIIGREVLSLGDRKVLGKVNGYNVNCDTLAVDYLFVSSKATKGTVALPWKKIFAIGDSYVTVADQNVLVEAGEASVKKMMANPYKMVGVSAFTKSGNKLAEVASFEFCSKTGKVAKIVLADKSAYAADKFVFFQPEFVFFNDDKKSAKSAVKKASKASAGAGAKKASAGNAGAGADAKGAGAASAGKKNAKGSAKGAAKKKNVDADGSVKKFLLGRALINPVSSADGAFKLETGEVLTEEMLAEAEAHDALVMLTMSVES